jgi:hypothetical protein
MFQPAGTLRLSLVENFHRVGLSVAETVAALDDLSEMVGEIGLRPAARLLNTAPSWLSERHQVRADPVNRSSRGAAAEEQSCRALVQQLHAFGAPRTATGRAALEELLGLVQDLLAQSAEPYARRRKQLRVLPT